MQLPKGKTLYNLLEIEKEQVDKDETIIKKAYRRLALQYHPDKQSSKTTSTQDLEKATQYFQLVGYAYSILNDSSKRKHYDLTGSLDGEDSFLSGDKDWTDYFKELWQGVVSTETIDAHSLKYKGSKEEEDDVLRYYTQLKGNMNHILAHVEHSKAADVPRFMDMISMAIKVGKVTSYPSYDKTTTKTAQLRRIKREQMEATAAKFTDSKTKEKNDPINVDKGKKRIDESENSDKGNGNGIDDDDLDTLREMMRARQGQRKNQMDTMIASMEKKAAKESSSQSKRGKANQRKRRHDDDGDVAQLSRDSTRKSTKSSK